MAISKSGVRWLIEATSSPQNHKLGDWVLDAKTPLDIFSKFHLGLISEWIDSAKKNPSIDPLSPWIAELTDLKAKAPKKGGMAGGFGVTLPVEKTVSFNNHEIKLLGQAKFYLSGWSDDFAARAESINLSDLNSRLIPKLYELGMTSGPQNMPYVVMERIEGFDLSIDKFRPLSASAFKTLATDTLRALKYAHEKKYFHTDIKPANIMYSELDDTYVIVDFGIARILKRDEVDGQVGGTQGYRAPEAYSEISAHKSDLYSLGLVFYYALTGKQPVLEALQKHWKAKKDFESKQVVILRDAEYQELIGDLKIDLSILAEDQASLLARMLEPDYKLRSEVTELIGLASQLQIGPQVFDVDSKNPWVILVKALENQLKQSGSANFRISVREKKHGNLWIKTITESGTLKLVCSRPKNPIKLSQLGWKNGAAGLMVLEIPDDKDFGDLARLISKALKNGYEIEPAFTYTFG